MFGGRLRREQCQPQSRSAGRPSGTACTSTNLKIDENRTLWPGTYCGGIQIEDEARVFLKPGIYIIKDGELEVRDDGELHGEYVGFYFTGNGAKVEFKKDSTIELGAPKDGPMAGLLFFEDRNNKKLEKFRIESNHARKLLGTIYLPQGYLFLDGDRDVAEDSAYTAVIARRMEMGDGPTFHLNTDYGATDVPVPDGIGPVGNNIVLSQ